MKLLKNISTTLIGLLLFTTVMAQQVNTLYFLENVPIRHSFNPAFQPLPSFYLSLPIIGNSQFNVGNNSLVASSLSLSDNDLLNSIKPSTLVNANVDVSLFGFGFRTHSSYWNFTLSSKSAVNLFIPKDMFKLGIFGNVNIVDGVAQLENNIYDLRNFAIHTNSYLEAALGFSQKIDDNWSYGVKFKYLHGLAAANLQFDSFLYNAGITKWTLNSNITANSDIPDLENLTINSLIKPAGVGGAVDLGITFRPFENFVFGAAVTDLGIMKWRKMPLNYATTTNYTLNNIVDFKLDEIIDGISSNKITSELANDFIDSLKITESANPFSTFLSTKINLSGEYGFLNNVISVGILSSTTVYNKSLFYSITPSINVRPANWLNLSFSYSLLNGREANIGAGLGLRIGNVNTFFTTDFIPINYASLNTPLTFSVPVLGNLNIAKVPAKTERLNFAVGVNIVFGNKLDRDKDGISNRRDKCADTPLGVIVDKKGCPLDTDGDKVPDYYDKCPDTPKEAYASIDADGCPIDTDGDGVFDYLDKCPGTIPAAYGKVDDNGCPTDTDKDGVPDYLDKCVATPEGVKTDSLGCPLDTDGDKVPDYLDKCPATPIAARGFIDLNGCPKDSDLDGVFDYLDKCPNTPAIARALVDSTGCDKDSDKDGVSDFLDKCPNTPLDAKGTIDQNGCPKDTDGDGVLDYLDNCPTVIGEASNKGCPELKKAVRLLFQKALQGIQFEIAKSTIKPVSFNILNDVAKVLSENQNYLVEVQGHTDNVGKKDANQKLSEDRAKAVRDYLLGRGIDEKRITSNGYGDTKPVLPNTSVANKAKNRRVEFLISFEEVKMVNDKP